MLTLSKQKQTAKELIQRSVMLTDKKKEKWLKRLVELGEGQLEALIQGLQKESGFLKGAIKGCVRKDGESLIGLKQVFRKSKKKIRIFEEKQHTDVDEQCLESLEKQLKDL